MSFRVDVLRFVNETKAKTHRVFVGSVERVHTSVTEGSALTGAPGQPVDTANLIRSWGPEFPEPLVGEVITNVEYAEAIEDGEVETHTRSAHTRGPYARADGTEVAQHSVREHVVEGYTFSQPYPGGGGPHSVKLTRAGWDRIVEDAVKEVAP
jgi:hypothetical protein